MSIISSLLLFLLCIYFHACNARLLGATGKEPEEKFHLPNKNDEKDTPKFKPALSNKLGAMNGATMVKKTRVEKEDHKPISSKAKELKDQGVKIQTESLFSVSWPVPHRKRGEQQPWFSLDYSPPQTHPPSHN